MTSARMPEIRWSLTLEESSHQCASLLVETAAAAICAKGRFTIALVGGSTPKRLYELLAEEPYVSRIDWLRVHVFWGDERCVPPDHADSNYRMARETLLARVPIPVGNIFPMPGAAEPEEGARQYEATIRRFFGLQVGSEFPAIDLVLLGLGTDGHTASLFPGSVVLKERRRLVAAVSPPQTSRPAVSRLTLTLPFFRKARNVWFLVSGEKKEGVAAATINGSPEDSALPGAMIRHPGSFWFLSECSPDVFGSGAGS